ncbi:DNA gyrase inhibitor YacG [Acidovorax sp. SRB_24]|uniref:DNA gyrase inhibitor YacG n=1 Tax=Acidovorax sp. SRB_24 TaxID=1962700 RepID=UPI00145D525E|nr:DNA gyrase inhibitor YacG [Acidovorax sp. SRB_24]NMM75651.1 DNA gyrase inhibitor YacG [Acidovorax sp. SRB_24]
MSHDHTPPAPPAAPKTVVCPSCGGPSLYGPQNPWRPFCSERCKQIDLGAWASESFRMPTEAPPDDAPHGDPRQQH